MAGHGREATGCDGESRLYRGVIGEAYFWAVCRCAAMCSIRRFGGVASMHATTILPPPWRLCDPTRWPRIAVDSCRCSSRGRRRRRRSRCCCCRHRPLERLLSSPRYVCLLPPAPKETCFNHSTAQTASLSPNHPGDLTSAELPTSGTVDGKRRSACTKAAPCSMCQMRPLRLTAIRCVSSL